MSPVRIAYVVSRFPAASETFVVREMNEVDADPEIDLGLMALFPSADGFLHPSAERWMARLEPPPGLRATAATLRWLLRRPGRLLGTVAIVAARTWRRPAILARSLATLPIAAAHAELVSKRRIDHLHAHFASYPALAAWVCRRLTGCGFSFTAHAYDIFVDRSMLELELRDAEFACTISRYNRDFIRSECGPSTTPIHVVHMGVDPDSYQFRPRMPPSSGPIRCLSVATLQEKKGHAVLLRALAGRDELSRIHLDLAGGGELREVLEKLAGELGLSGRISFHGAVPESAVRSMLAGADLFVLPSIVAADGQMEGLPVALIEAVASGVPSVASRMSGIPELIEDGVTGYLAEPGDAGDLAAALELAVSGRPLDLEAGRKLVEDEFDVRVSGARMAALFRSTARSR